MPYGYNVQRTNGLAIASLVVGILGIFPFYFAGLLLGPVALTMGIIGNNQIKRAKMQQKGSGMAIAGIVLGSIATVIGLIAIIAIVAFINVANNCARNPGAPGC